MREILTLPKHPEGLTTVQENLLLQLFNIGAVKFGGFPLKLHQNHPEAPLSPIYFDLRRLQRYPKVKKAAVDSYYELAKPLRFDLLAGIPLASIPLVSSLSDKLGVGMITPRIDRKGYGTGEQIDGFEKSDRGKTALLMDDLISGAHSKLEAVTILIENKLTVTDIVVLIDRDQGGREQLAERGLTLHSAMKISQILDLYGRIGLINIDDRARIDKDLQDLNRFLALYRQQQ
jgi:uridine monophosphate synthetase